MRIVIAGYGQEGEASLKYFREKYPNAEFIIYDQKDIIAGGYLPRKNLEFKLSDDIFDEEIKADIVVRTNSLRPDKIKTLGEITTGTNEFFKNCPAQIIGVTGTKGKGTTASFIKSILDAAGYKTWLLGNIGVPALSALKQIKKDDIVIYELSSFQLWDIKYSPHIAVILGIEPDHLDVHRNYQEYLEAKSNIVKYQNEGDVVIYKSSNQESTNISRFSASSQKVSYGENADFRVESGYFWCKNTKTCPSNTVIIPGQHNLENACAAIAACWGYTQNSEIITKGLGDFKGLPHHIEKVREVNGVTYYDDSFSSAPSAAIVAIKAMTRPTVLILGGYDRDIDFSNLVQTISELQTIKKIILIGQTREKIKELLMEAAYEDFEVYDTQNFSEVVLRARDIATPGDNVLLSPGCASFDMFKNFYERGDKFKEIVGSL
jgi:UDP-N-acetylmuramoylalanine--D-glutamate ligase